MAWGNRQLKQKNHTRPILFLIGRDDFKLVVDYPKPLLGYFNAEDRPDTKNVLFFSDSLLRELNMNKLVRLFFAVLFCCSTTLAVADSTIISLSSFKDVQKLLLEQKHPHQVLLALDDDDTLTMMPCPSQNHCQYLGGPAWFEWQSTLPADSKDRIWKSFSQLLDINKLIFTMSRMDVDDPAIPNALKTADKLGVHTLVVSARGYDMMGATEVQFSQDHIFKLIEKNAIKTNGNHISYLGFYLPTAWSDKLVRPISYVHGVLYLAGQNKGEMLRQFLSKTGNAKRIHDIIFVDDTMQNVKDVASAYAKDPAAHVISISA